MPRKSSRLKVGVEREGLFFLGSHDARLLILANAFLEEVRLSFQTDVLHEVEGIFRVELIFATQLAKQTIRDKFDVSAHEFAVHANEIDGQRVGEEFLFKLDGVDDNLQDARSRRLIYEMLEHQTREVAVQSLVARNQLVAESQTWHESSLLHPKDGGERSREEDSLDGGKSHNSFGVSRVLSVDPRQSPIRLLFSRLEGSQWR